MLEIILDGEKMTDELTTHKMFKEIFEFPDYYGHNDYALWDCITDWYLDGKAKIIWKNFNKSKEYLGEDADIMLKIFRRAAEQYGDFTIEVIE